ncbi:MAG: acetoin utilization protein AcuC [Candidatus Aenigmarchaeota archaeon]|nr:acetoin utilization protein AcuC [Candidatus Aenigmarchaeota archaeon]
MSGVTAFVYSDDYLNYQFGPTHPFQPIREKYTFDLLKDLEIFDEKAKHYKPDPASEEDLLLVHSKDYIEFVKKMSEKGRGYLDYGDTPATKGIYEAACSVVGGNLLAADLIMNGKVSHAFNPAGGLHHAKRDRAAGFCVFNDIAIVTRYLQKNYNLERIAIVDIDGHHGDGTQQIFYNEPILKISLHKYGFGFYPGTGDVIEIGDGPGRGYSVNIPLPEGTSDKTYLYAFNEIVPPLIKKYKPEILINQFGVDAHYQDPLVGLSLTTKSYEKISSTMHELAHEISGGRYLIVGGGGYNIKNVVRCWTIMFVTVSGVRPKNTQRYEELFDPEIKEEDRTLEKVKETVERLKKMIFPLHKI